VPNALRILVVLQPLLALTHGFASEMKPVPQPRFTASISCQSSSCHGGGVGNDQYCTWEKKDPHSRAHAVLSTSRSARMAEALGIPDPQKSSRCTVCHSPMRALPPERFVKGALPEKGVSCESCHGPAEPWILFHTRKDTTHAQRVAAGLRELTDLYSRANTCVACHLNIDGALVAQGNHPEMFFELDGQMQAQPPHYADQGAWIGPRAWLAGQGVALREISWKLASEPNRDDLVLRWKALAWLLSITGSFPESIQQSGNYKTTQAAADQLARTAANSPWSQKRVSELLKTYSALGSEFSQSPLPPSELVRKSEVLVMAIDRLWVSLKKETGTVSGEMDQAIVALTNLAKAQAAFDPAEFGQCLDKLRDCFSRLGLPKPGKS
jgi:hypothetical protein